MSGDFSIFKKRTSSMRDCQEYYGKLKIKKVGFEDFKKVNFEKFILVIHVFISVCCMANIVELILKERLTVVQYDVLDEK